MHEMKLEDNSQCLLLQYDFLEESNLEEYFNKRNFSFSSFEIIKIIDGVS